MATSTLIWSDEFDAAAGTPPDPRWWHHETGSHGWSNDELQSYTNLTANAAHDGEGNLVIRATRHVERITSARIITRGRFEFAYGRLECRARVPSGRGLWSAVWTLGGNISTHPWPACGEIDVMEILGSAPQRVFGTVHCPGHYGAGGISGCHRAPVPLSDGFHVYAVDWHPNRIIWTLDGLPYFEVRAADLGSAWVFDHPFYVLLNLAVGGTLGGEVGADTEFPADFLIDYVRVYAGA